MNRNYKDRSGRSGVGADNIPVDPKYEHVLWLNTFIISRPSSGNFKQPFAAEVSTQPLQNGSDSSQESNDQADSGDNNIASRSSTSTVVNQMPEEYSSQSNTKEKSNKNWTKTDSRKRKLEKADRQLENTISSLSASIKQQQGSSTPVDKEEMNEDSLYCMSLASRLRKLDGRNKAVVRNATEKMFLDIEFGYCNYPRITCNQANSVHKAIFKATICGKASLCQHINMLNDTFVIYIC